MLGTTALYLEEGIAIHGTNAPELLGQPVSAGCIRMTNEMARLLYHEVNVGTPVRRGSRATMPGSRVE
jgi:lipoprotein-anchoring transpeptidase ErfK/SrfK